jgi:hypothetical protein
MHPSANVNTVNIAANGSNYYQIEQNQNQLQMSQSAVQPQQLHHHHQQQPQGNNYSNGIQPQQQLNLQHQTSARIVEYPASNLGDMYVFEPVVRKKLNAKHKSNVFTFYLGKQIHSIPSALVPVPRLEDIEFLMIF